LASAAGVARFVDKEGRQGCLSLATSPVRKYMATQSVTCRHTQGWQY